MKLFTLTVTLGNLFRIWVTVTLSFFVLILQPDKYILFIGLVKDVIHGPITSCRM